MTFDEAVILYEKLKPIVVGVVVKEMLIDSLYIFPTDWELVTDFWNLQIKKGAEEAIETFRDKSFSVYGACTKESHGIPNTTVTILDDYLTILNN